MGATTFENSSSPAHSQVKQAIAGLVIWLLVSLIPASSQQSEPYTYSVSVDRVVLDVSVRGQNRELLHGLAKENFSIYEDGKLQEIKSFDNGDVPVAVGLIIDNSHSMLAKRAEVISAALLFIESSNSGDEFFIVSFDDYPQLALPQAHPFSNDVAELEAATKARTPGGRTALYDAIALGMDHLRTARLERRELVIISDGGDNVSHKTFPQILEAVRRSDVGIYSIALSDPDAVEQNVAVLKQLSAQSGGEFFLQPTLKEIGQVCRRIAQDIRMQYTLTYTPTNKARDGSYRKIKVTANDPNGERTFIRTKPGYFAPLDGVVKTNLPTTKDRDQQ